MRIKTFFKTLIPLKALLLLFMCTLFSYTLSAQAEATPASCSTDEYMKALFENDEHYEAVFLQANQQITDAINQNPNIGGDHRFVIPVVVHVMHDGTDEVVTDLQINNAITELNARFEGPGNDLPDHPFDANTGIQFQLATIDPNCNATDGIVRINTTNSFGFSSITLSDQDIAMKDQSRWPIENYLNIWVVDNIVSDINGQEVTGFSAGYSPIGFPVGQEGRDGVVVKFDSFGQTDAAMGNFQNTLTHEVGHYLSLFHPWGAPISGDICEVRCHDNDLLTSLNFGDYVWDTNPCRTDLLLSVDELDCSLDYNGTCEAEGCITDYPDLPYPKESYMSYNHACQTGFSAGQTQRMCAEIEVFRQELVSPENAALTGIIPVQQDVTIPQNTTQTWSVPPNETIEFIRIDGNLTIQSGATLTVAPGVIVMFGPQSAVIVEAGAQLVMNGSTFTACDTWQGIQVLGNPSLNQTAANQGRIFMNSGATIEHANIGIITGSLSDGTTGGIVQAFNGSTFRNNVIDVAFEAYENIASGIQQNNISSLNLCHSLIDDDYRFSNDQFDGKIEPFILMDGVNGITVRGHHFEDQRSIINASRPSGKIGIAATFSGFQVNEWCPGISPLPAPATCEGTRTRFVNLGYGIDAASANHPSFPVNVRNSDFNGWHGIYLNGVNAPQIYINNFFVRQMLDPTNGNSGSPLLIHSYGIYLDNSTDYRVEENSFEGQVDVGAPPSEDEHAGIIVRNNHGFPTEIYNNQFHHLSVGVEGVSQNRSEGLPANAVGLRFACNDFTETRVDMFVMEDLDAPQAVPIAGIAPIQDLTANLFSTTNSIRNIWRHNGAESIQYIHHDDSNEPRLRPTWAQFALFVDVQNSGVEVDNSTCVNNIIPKMATSNRIVTLLNTKNSANNEYRGLLGTLRNLTDNGNTPQMLAWVQLANDVAAADEVYLKIMQQAPFTSDAVLEALSKKESGFRIDMIRDILCQHPQAAKSAQIQENLDLRTQQLPQTMRDQIDEGRQIRSEKEQMELRAARHKRTRNQAISTAIQELAADTIDRTADMIQFLENTGEIGFDYRLAEIYDAQNNTELANQTLNSIGQRKLSEKAASDHADYTNFRTLMQTWKAAEKDLARLEAAEIEMLHQYAIQPNTTAAKAIALLKLNNIFDYTERFYFPEIEENISPSQQSDDITDSDKLLIYPNPATEHITIRHSLLQSFEEATLTVTDIMGKTVYQQNIIEKQNELIIHVGKLPQGQYFCTLKSDNVIVTEKFLLIQ